MFILYARKNQLTVREREPVTSGSVNIYTARFEFSPDWSGLTKKAIFQAGKETRTVLLDKDGVCTIPWEVLADHGQSLRAGVFGTADETALPTTWASLGMILEGVSAAGAPEPAPPPVGWQEALDRKGDRLAYTETGELGLYSGDRELSSVPMEGGSGECGATDHRRLSHRDAEEQHPISSISGLEKELSRIPGPVEALTNTELEEMLK